MPKPDSARRAVTPTAQRGDSTPASDDSDDTPRSELPSNSVVPTPAHFVERDAEEGYFAPHPTQGQTSAEVSSLAVQSASSTTSSRSSSRASDKPMTELTNRLSAYLEASSADRPGVQRDHLSHASAASTESTDSTMTITPASLGYSSHLPTVSEQVYTANAPSRFPNQAFSALQHQRYPPPHLPPNLRTRTFHPAQPATFRQAIQQLQQSGSKTTGNTPAVTHGLFTPTTPITQSDLGPDEHGHYASPFLHYTHRQAPKETHIADVDIDPISGRKLINNYEIIDELGRGTHGKVKLGRNLDTHEYVAIKIVERYSKKRRLGKLGNAEDKVKKEVAILKKARHPNIVALLEVIDDPARKKVYIVLERVELGEINWRAEAPREVALLECRRYEREARGGERDYDAEQEDRAILEEARARRIKHQRRLLRRTRRQRMNSGDAPEAWSFEFGADTDEDESDLERASRVSTTTTENSIDLLAMAVRPTSRAQTRAHPAENETTHVSTPVAAPISSCSVPENVEDAEPIMLQGTMYGSYEGDESGFRAPSLAGSVRSFGPLDLTHRPSSRQSASAAELLDSDIHPDLLYVPCMPMHAIRVAFRDTVLGLEYLHWQGIIHRDIKPPNLLQTIDHRVKISDFGVSYLGRPIGDDQMENLSESDAQDFDEAKELAKTVGTAAFYAPELCYTDVIPYGEKAPAVGKAIDVWALGVTLFCMLFGRTPFVDSEYVVMRRIADEDIYIPNKRLRPVDPRPKSRPSSHGRFPITPSGKRSEYELSYEELDDSLLDLISRLLIKDPDHRITLEEVRLHPWVIQDITDKAAWLNDSDPARQTQGKKIQVSKEELQDAVVPVKLVERIRSGLKKTVGGIMSGLGRASSTRSRAQSNTGSQPPSSSSSSSAISQQDGRRSSLRGDESIFSALKASRETEHPLAQSVTASPERPAHEEIFSAASTPTGGAGRRDLTSQELDPSRPELPERAKSIMSTTTSVRTIRASHMLPSQTGETPPPSPVLTQDAVAGSNLGGLLSGAGRRILKSVRDRSTAARGGDGTDSSRSRAPSEAGDPHTDPSVAVTNAVASGQLDPPQALKELTPLSSTVNSPALSRVHSSNTMDQRHEKPLQVQSPSMSLPTRRRIVPDVSVTTDRLGPDTRLPHESTAESFRRAEDEWTRRRVRENNQKSATGQHDRPSTKPLSPDACPPSPDDDLFGQRRVDALKRGNSSTMPSSEASPVSRGSSTRPPMSPSSSDDKFHNGSPMTRSNPSIPSVTTIDSEAPPEARKAYQDHGELLSSGDTIQIPSTANYEDEGYAGDHAIDGDDDDSDYEDSSDEDGGLQMKRRKSIPHKAESSFGSTGQPARLQRRETGSSAFSKKSSRSGSNNTMKKVITREEPEPEDDRGRTL